MASGIATFSPRQQSPADCCAHGGVLKLGGKDIPTQIDD